MTALAAARPATSPARLTLYYLLLAATWGASFLFMRQATLEFGPLPTAAVRVTVAALFLLPLLLAHGQWPALRRHWRPVLLCGL
ncbi:MAG TPA: EamA family transporter, partial [Ottowia sp.]|nr:EamA family transporter [Ottowia sp.]